MNQDVLYDRQQTPEPNHQDTICVIGCGGMGTWASIITALTGVSKCLILVDGDEIEKTNLNRLPFTEDDVGRKKVNVLKEFIDERRPDLPVLAFDEHFTQDFYDDKLDIEVDKYFFCAEGDAHQIVSDVIPDGKFRSNEVLFLAGDNQEIQLRTDPIGFQSDTGTGDYDNVSALDTIGGGLALVFNYIGMHNSDRNIASFLTEHEIFSCNPIALKNSLEKQKDEADRWHDRYDEQRDLNHDIRNDLREEQDRVMELEGQLRDKGYIIDRLEEKLEKKESVIGSLRDGIVSLVDEYLSFDIPSIKFVDIFYECIEPLVNPSSNFESSNSWGRLAEKRDMVVEFFTQEDDE